MADKSAEASQIDGVKARSFAARCARLWTKSAPNSEINPQLNSPLFTLLPQELRDRIWKFAFEPPENAKPAHFHIYDHIYDSCTYPDPDDINSTTRAELRKRQTHVALLLSCRRIYHESLHYLYEQSKFTFVVFAGLPRGYCSKKRHQDRCKCLGRVQDCEPMLRRMRNLTIIIQAGKNPETDAYNYRLQELLKALSYGRHLESLTLIFNWRLEIVSYDPTQASRKLIVKALYPLQTRLAPRIAARKCKLTIFSWHAEHDSEELEEGEEDKYFRLIRTIGGLDNDLSNYCIHDGEGNSVGARESYCMQDQSHRPSEGPKGKIVQWCPLSTDYKKQCVRYGADLCCLERGAFGEDNWALKQMQPIRRTPLRFPLPGVNLSKEEVQCGLLLAGYLMFAPITIPITVFTVVKRKKDKGEKSWWS